MDCAFSINYLIISSWFQEDDKLVLFDWKQHSDSLKININS